MKPIAAQSVFVQHDLSGRRGGAMPALIDLVSRSSGDET